MPVDQPPGANIPSTLIFSCSGAADVGELADRAARALTKCGNGAMFCLAGVGAGIPDMVERAKGAKKLLVIDGCDKDCGRLALQSAGFAGFTHLRVTDCGFEKGRSLPTIQNVVTVTERAAEKLS
jgi:uncharacterized metal-binding protein